MNEGHFKDLLFELIPPPAQRSATRTAAPGASNPTADLMMMGFPTRLPDTSPPALCVCHSELKSEGFLCPRCSSKVCDVPTDCDICGLMIVSSPHLARSYHHLFPVKPYQAVCVHTMLNTAWILISSLLIQHEGGYRLAFGKLSRVCNTIHKISVSTYGRWHEHTRTVQVSGLFE